MNQDKKLITHFQERQQQVKENLKKYWDAEHHFNCPDDIPDVPVYDSDEDAIYYIGRLVSFGAIPKKDLVKGHRYVGKCRNAQEAVWNGSEFIYDRYKFGHSFSETICHFEDDSDADIFIPIKDITENEK